MPAPLAPTASKARVEKFAHPKPDARSPAFLTVGGVPGLMLQCTTKGQKSWVFRYTIGGRRRAMGLGRYCKNGQLGYDLEGARARAMELFLEVRNGSDPMKVTKAAKAEVKREIQISGITFAEAVVGWDKATAATRSAGNHARVVASLKRLGTLKDKPLAAITDDHVWGELEALFNKGSLTVPKDVRGRIANVFTWAAIEHNLKLDNPADHPRLIQRIKTKSAAHKVAHRAAVGHDDAPRFAAAIRARDAMSFRALEFLMLTAVRSGEVRKAKWEQIDYDKKLWIIPAEQMKMKRPHIVPLSDRAIALLESLPNGGPSDFIFANTSGKPLSDVIFSQNMGKLHDADEQGFVDADTGERATAHGLRSTFRDWCGSTGVERELAELCLAHKVGDAAEQAYARDSLVARRAPVMQAWSEFLDG